MYFRGMTNFLLLICSVEYHLRPLSATHESLAMMGFSSLSIEKAIKEKGSSMSECIQYILQQSVDSVSSFPEPISLPSIHSNDLVQVDCQGDLEFFTFNRQFYGEDDYQSILHVDNMKYAWSLPFRREFALMNASMDDERSESDYLHLIHQIRTVLSRSLLSQFFYKSNQIPFTPFIHTILNITALQEVETQSQYKELLIQSLKSAKSDIIQHFYHDLTYAVYYICRNQYSESQKRMRSVLFNTDIELCEVAQLRLVCLVTSIFAELSADWNASIIEFYKWIFFQWCKISQVGNPVLQQIACDTLYSLCQLVLMQASLLKWTLVQLQNLSIGQKTEYAFHQEIKSYPILSKPLRSLFQLNSFVQVQSKLQNLPSPTNVTLHCYHLKPHGFIRLSKQVIQPPWAVEFWFRSVISANKLILFGSTNQSIQIKLDTNQLMMITDHQFISFSLPCELKEWNHFAIEIDAITNVNTCCYFYCRNAASI